MQVAQLVNFIAIIVAILNSQTLFLCVVEEPIMIGFNQAQYRESEGAGAVPVTVQLLTGRLERMITVRMYTMDGEAIGWQLSYMLCI